MSSISNSDLLKALNWRYAVKKFDAEKKIPVNDWQTLEQVLVLTPSSYGLQPWKFLVVQNPEVRKQLTPHAHGQTQVQDCSHFVVLTHMRTVSEDYIKHYVHFTAQLRGLDESKLAGYLKTMIGDVVHGPRSKVIDKWAGNQIYIAMGNVLTAAALIGIDACPMEGLDPVEFDRVLNLNSTNYKTSAAIAFGYRSEKDDFSKMKKSRFDLSKIIEVV